MQQVRGCLPEPRQRLHCSPRFQKEFQTLHLDAYCNECGNCAQFCPWNGKPYKDKITVFSLAKDFDNSSNPGFLVEDCRVQYV
ncbi:hypothetical protein ACLK19_19185 [Escherichia coli]